MKILFVTRKWPPAVGGMELYSAEIVRAMGRIADVDTFALPGRSDGSPPAAAALASFLVRATLRLAIAGRRYDVIHFGDFVLFPLMVWAHLVAPRAHRGITVHGLDLLYGHHRGFAPAVYRAFVAIARRLQGSADTLVANSRATAAVAERLGFARVVPVPLGISLDTDNDVDPATVETNGTDRFILFVGRLVRRKGAAWFANQVVPLLPDDVGFKVVGTPWDRDEVAAVEAAPRTSYLGRVGQEDLSRLRHAAALTVMPNRAVGAADMEGFGLAALEAVAANSLLVASGIEGIKDAVIDGSTGFLLPEGEPQIWATKIRELLDWPMDRRVQFLENARAVLKRQYSWDRVARETLDAIAR